jgi:hypothetical protein
MQREPIVLNQIVVAPELYEIVASHVHRSYRDSLQPIANVVATRAASTPVECQMVGGMLRQAPVADEFRVRAIVACMSA